MSMLAAPRRKQKLSADPRGNNWSKDGSKFGQKMLEKFGWSNGKGLGANEDGNVEHVKISLKNDTRGVGCSKNHADNWIAHQDDFNDLLSSLNQNGSDKDNNDEDSSDKVTGLEKKSKASRSRVHYQKFTKGKDLSSKSQEDMACIFGRRKIKQDTSSEDDGSSSDSENKMEHGVITVRSTDSVQDYFAKKMAEKKAALKSPITENLSPPEVHSDTEIPNNQGEEKKSKKKKVRFSLGEEEDVGVDMSKTKKKKKKKKSKENGENRDETISDCTADLDQVQSSENCDINDGKRKRKHLSESEVDVEVEVVKSKKQKKSKRQKYTDNGNNMDTDGANSNSLDIFEHVESETKISIENPEKLLSKSKGDSDDDHKSKKVKKNKKAKHCQSEEENSQQVQTGSRNSDILIEKESLGEKTFDSTESPPVQESVKFERDIPISSSIQRKLERIRKARMKYTQMQMSSESKEPSKSETKVQKNRCTKHKSQKTQNPSDGQKALESKTISSKKRQPKTKNNKKAQTAKSRSRKSSDNRKMSKLKRTSGECYNQPSKLHKEVVEQSETIVTAFPGSNCIELTGYGEGCGKDLTDQIVKK
ncbi:PIN2/TERF1-interacting telomerase inhibitor 1-like [Ylistrum balloti]|uniref:PIN2/TERF1-interacting telomerase inhibitor 1-like n=1 Tax=Ylistrum balloti TaxID=509963 RepID=UPI002905DD29|nr:PIN2/TERF1-interacting telomerase inhibitor 1-like [Ylistrum balloti]